MAKKNVDYYENKLREMIKQRRRIENVEPWLEAQLTAAAMNWQMVDKVHEELCNGKLMSYENGSTGQTKAVANPLLTSYKELQRTHILHMRALGLNFETLPKKMTESASNVPDENDQLMQFLNGIGD